MKIRPLNALLLHVVVLLAGVAFAFPLAWMVLTALKPLEQTMTLPPVWLPHRLYLPDTDPPVEARQVGRFERPMVRIERDDTGETEWVPREYVSGDELRVISSTGEETARFVHVLEEIDASPEAPWYRLRAIHPDGSLGEERLLPANQVTRRISLRWDNFILALRAMRMFPRYLANTVVLCLLTVCGTVISCALVAYGFSRIDWPGRDRLFILALATMMIPFPVVMVPLYGLFRWLGWIGSLKPLWVGAWFAPPFYVFLLRQFFLTIPAALADAARIDGCNEFAIFRRVLLPLVKPALLVVALFQFMATWNDFLGPLIFLTDQRDFTLALGLQYFQSQHGGTEWHYLMAASTVVILPVIVLFFFTQRTFIEGISMTGLKE